MPRQRKLPEGMRQRGKVYYAWFRANGRHVRKRLSGDFKVACDLLKEMKARAARADFGLTDNDYPWDDLKNEFLRWKRQASRVPEEYAKALCLCEEYCRVQSIRQIDHVYVFGFREWRLAHGVCPRTVNKQVGYLRTMLNTAVLWGRIGENPIAGLKPLPHDEPLKQRRSLTENEVIALFDASPDYLRLLWRMFMCTGIRLEELVGMKFEDVDFDRCIVTVRASTAKNHKSREIPLDDEILATIADLKRSAPHRQPVGHKNPNRSRSYLKHFSRDHVFVTRINTPWRHNLLRRFYKCCERAGIEDAHPGGSVDIHALRVSFTTLAIDGGARPKDVQEILGHSTLDLTMGIYAKATERGKRNAINALPFAKSSTPDHVVSIEERRRDTA